MLLQKYQEGWRNQENGWGLEETRHDRAVPIWFWVQPWQRCPVTHGPSTQLHGRASLAEPASLGPSPKIWSPGYEHSTGRVRVKSTPGCRRAGEGTPATLPLPSQIPPQQKGCSDAEHHRRLPRLSIFLSAEEIPTTLCNTLYTYSQFIYIFKMFIHRSYISYIYHSFLKKKA